MVNESMEAAILEEAMKEITKSPELVSDVLHNLNEIGAEGTMSNVYAVDKERDDSYITLYSTFDGTASTVLKVMAPKMLRKRIPRIPEAPAAMWGQLAFSLNPPKNVVERPKFLCDLNPDNPKREWLDSVGLAGKICPKANLANQFEVLRHRRLVHGDVNSMIELAEQREREAEQREYQKSLITLIAKQAEGGANAKPR